MTIAVYWEVKQQQNKTTLSLEYTQISLKNSNPSICFGVSNPSLAETFPIVLKWGKCCDSPCAFIFARTTRVAILPTVFNKYIDNIDIELHIVKFDFWRN